MGHRIQVHEVREESELEWIVSIKYGDVERHCKVRDPLLLAFDFTEDDVRWLLEDYPTRFPYDLDNALSKQNALKRYGQLLAEQLELPELIQSAGGDHRAVWIVDVCDGDGESTFHKLYWETLEQILAENDFKAFVRRKVKLPLVEDEPQEKKQATSVDDSRAAVEGKVLNSKPLSEDMSPVSKIYSDGKSTRRRFNVLLVVSRPSKKDDINPLIATNGILDILMAWRQRQQATLGTDSDLDISLEISRPGTWAAFEEHLKGRAKMWHYAGGKDGWFDLVHFDCHGTVKDGVASLLFLSSSGNKTLKCSAEKIGALLKSCHVNQVVLHSCETAKVTRSARSNMASTLIGMGIETVVAMSFKFTTSAAEVFIKAFYHQLFSDSSTEIGLAFLFARNVLKHEKSRIGRLNVIVTIPDFIIPVIYASKDQSLPTENVTRVFDELHASGANTEKFAATDKDDPVIGREQDALEVEWRILRSPKNNILALTGDVGIGKTSFLELLIRLWGLSGLVGSVKYLDMAQQDPVSVIEYLQSQKPKEPEIQGKRKNLIIIDQLDAVMHQTSVYARMMSVETRELLKSAVLDLRGTLNLVILASRRQDNWLALPQSQIYRLGPLSKYHATSLASRILKALEKDEFLKKKEDTLYIEYLLGRLDYNPLSLDMFFSSMVAQRENLRLQGKEKAAQDALGIHPDTPKLLYNMTLRDGLFMNPAHPMKQEIMRLVKNLLGDMNGNMPVLFALAIPSNIYRREWHDGAAECICAHFENPKYITGDQLDHFVSVYLLDSGWMDSFETLFADGSRKRYYRIHPLLTNAFRQLLISVPSGDIWLSALTQRFMHFYCLCILSSFTVQDFLKKQIHLIEVECYNFLNAVDSFLYTLELNEWPPDHRALKHGELLWVLQAIHDASVRGRSERLAMEVVQVRLENFIAYLESRLKEGYLDGSGEELGLMNNIHTLIEMYNRLTTNCLRKDPQLGAYYADRALQVAIQGCEKNISWNPSNRNAVAIALLHRGESSLHYKGRSFLARQAFEMALRCYRREDDSEESQQISAKIRSRGFAGLHQAMRALKEFHDYTDDTVNVAAYEKAASKAEMELYGDDPDRIFASLAGLSLAALGETPSTKPSAPSPYLQDAMMGSNLSLWTSITRAGELRITGSFTAAKDMLLSGVNQAQRDHDVYAEHAYRYALIDLAEEQQDWPAAAMHIVRAMALETQSSSSGPNWFTMTQPDRLIREGRHGTVFLRLGMLEHALHCFDRGMSAMTGYLHTDILEPSSPEAFVDVVLDVGRFVLLMLTAYPVHAISVPQFYQLDDILQIQTVTYVFNRWPEFDGAEGQNIVAMMKRPPMLDRLSDKDAKGIEADMAAGLLKRQNVHSTEMVRMWGEEEEDEKDNKEGAGAKDAGVEGEKKDVNASEEMHPPKKAGQGTSRAAGEGSTNAEVEDTRAGIEAEPHSAQPAEPSGQAHPPTQRLSPRPIRPPTVDEEKGKEISAPDKEAKLNFNDDDNKINNDEANATRATPSQAYGQAQAQAEKEGMTKPQTQTSFPFLSMPKDNRRIYRLLIRDPTPPDLCNLSPLEAGMPLYNADPEGDFEGILKHEILDLPGIY